MTNDNELLLCIINELGKDEYRNFFDPMVTEYINNNYSMTTIREDEYASTFITEVSSICLILIMLEKKYGEAIVNNLIDIANGRYKYKKIFAKIKEKIANAESSIEIVDAYEIANIFQSLQNKEDKKMFGQFYTPNHIIDKIIEHANIDYDNLKNQKILDPSCGAGVIYLKLIDVLVERDCNYILNIVNSAFYGYDINPNAIFLTKMSIMVHLIDIHVVDEMTLKLVSFADRFIVTNTLFTNQFIKYQYIIGNPPYFKLKNSKYIKEKYSDFIYGQANAYGLFLIWSSFNVAKGGKVSFVIPQSIKNGKYFVKIRKRLLNFAINVIHIIDPKSRNDIFENVEQAVMIIAFGNTGSNQCKVLWSVGTKTSKIEVHQEDVVNIDAIITPSSKSEITLYKKIYKNTLPFSDIEPNLVFGNGLYVWNQNKRILKKQKENDCLPIVYANYCSEGKLVFDPNKNCNEKNGKAPFSVKEGNESFVLSGIKLLVKRTSNVDKRKRIAAFLITEDFTSVYSEYFVENHLNMLYVKNNKRADIDFRKLKYILAYLNSSIPNYWIYLRNGNTQVSANELNSMPFINGDIDLVNSLWDKNNMDEIDNYFYGIIKLTKNEITVIEKFKEANHE